MQLIHKNARRFHKFSMRRVYGGKGNQPPRAAKGKPFKLIAPDGTVYEGRNLTLWGEHNLHLFENFRKPDESEDDFRRRVYYRLRALNSPTYQYTANGEWGKWRCELV